ncbi:MAG: GLPGLI family protein [Cyclobacteriaceae bacterium]
MKKTLILLLFLLPDAVTGLSQTGKYQVVYRQSLAPSEPIDKVGVLLFDKAHSLYYCNRSGREVKELIYQSDTEMAVDIRDKEGFSFYTDFQSKTLISRYYIPGDEFVILTEEGVTINWQVDNELKKIGNFICRKATTTFRGRQWTVWFTEEIPIPAGPWKLHGLPGLIVEAEDETKIFYFYLEKLNKVAENSAITPPGMGTKIKGWDNYCAFVRKRIDRLKSYLETYNGLTVSISMDNYIEKIDK